VPSFLHIGRTEADDLRALKTYIREGGKGATTLRTLRNYMQQQYALYRGKYFRPNELLLPRAKKASARALYDLYDSRKNCLGYISALREAGRRLGSCPYCGLPGSISLDHYLPRSTKRFPQFSVLSLNLVPACMDCQSAKGAFFSLIKPTRNSRRRGGLLNKRRILHPYFDKFLKKPLLSIDFAPYTGLGTPLMGTVIPGGAAKPAEASLVRFHLSKLNVATRAESDIDRHRQAVVEDLRDLPAFTMAAAMKRVESLSKPARKRGGGATNCVELAFYRSLSTNPNLVSQLLNEASTPVQGLIKKSSLLHF